MLLLQHLLSLWETAFLAKSFYVAGLVVVTLSQEEKQRLEKVQEKADYQGTGKSALQEKVAIFHFKKMAYKS